jgi:hypothetical protein
MLSNSVTSCAGIVRHSVTWRAKMAVSRFMFVSDSSTVLNNIIIMSVRKFYKLYFWISF